MSKTFKDKKGNIIEIEELSEYHYQALHNGQPIGEIIISDDEKNAGYFTYSFIHVDEEYRGLGIAEELFKYAKDDYYNQKLEHPHLENIPYERMGQDMGMTDCGYGFFKAMQRKGLLTTEQEKDMNNFGNHDDPNDDPSDPSD